MCQSFVESSRSYVDLYPHVIAVYCHQGAASKYFVSNDSWWQSCREHRNHNRQMASLQWRETLFKNKKIWYPLLLNSVSYAYFFIQCIYTSSILCQMPLLLPSSRCFSQSVFCLRVPSLCVLEKCMQACLHWSHTQNASLCITKDWSQEM